MLKNAQIQDDGYLCKAEKVQKRGGAHTDSKSYGIVPFPKLSGSYTWIFDIFIHPT